MKKNVTLMSPSAVIEYVKELEDRVDALIKEVAKQTVRAEKAEKKL